MTSEAIEQDRLFVVLSQYFRTSLCPITGTAEYKATLRGSTSGWSWYKEKRGAWDEERPSRCGIMLNKPTWKDVRHFESILESLCSLRIFYVYLLRATRTTLPLPPYNSTPSPLFLPTPAFGLFFPLVLSYPLGFKSCSLLLFLLILLLFLIFLLRFHRSGCTLEDGSYLRGTRSTLHRRDPVANPHPRRFDLVSPLPR